MIGYLAGDMGRVQRTNPRIPANLPGFAAALAIAHDAG